jgi:HK97 family phage major capsid protein
MRKTVELKKIIDEQKKKVDGLYNEEQFDAAVKEAEELNKMMDEYHVADAMEKAIFQKSNPLPLGPKTMLNEMDMKRFHNRVFNKLLLGEKFGFPAMTEEEKKYATKNLVENKAGSPGQVGVTPTKGGYLIPTEQMNTILEFRRAYTELKNYCNVQVATSRNGTQPTAGEEDGKLVNFEELTEITQSDIDFGQIKYDIKDYGDIIPIANQLLQDIDVNLIDFVGKRFAKKAVNTENDQIVSMIKTLTPTAITDYKGINTALNKTLDPAISANATIFTNQSGYDYLDQLEDSQKRPLLNPDVTAPGQYRYRGRQIVVLKDTLLPCDASALPFLVGSLSDFATFFDRIGVEMAISTEALFTKYATAMRVVERFDVVKTDANAMVLLNYTKA